MGWRKWTIRVHAYDFLELFLFLIMIGNHYHDGINIKRKQYLFTILTSYYANRTTHCKHSLVFTAGAVG